MVVVVVVVVVVVNRVTAPAGSAAPATARAFGRPFARRRKNEQKCTRAQGQRASICQTAAAAAATTTTTLRASGRVGKWSMAGRCVSSRGWKYRSLRAGGHLRRADASRTSGTSSRFHAKGFVAPVPLHAAAYTTSQPISDHRRSDPHSPSIPIGWLMGGAKLKTGFNVSKKY